MHEPNLLQALQSEACQFSTDAGGYDILDGCSLFAVVAIRRGLLSASAALSRVPATKRSPDFAPYPGAKCPSFAGPIRIALEHVNADDRELSVDDVWAALQQHDETQFRLLCGDYSIDPSA